MSGDISSQERDRLLEHFGRRYAANNLSFVLSGNYDWDAAVEQIRRIRDQGTTIVFVEHVMDAVMALTDRLVVFDHGAMLAEGFLRKELTISLDRLRVLGERPIS